MLSPFIMISVVIMIIKTIMIIKIIMIIMIIMITQILKGQMGPTSKALNRPLEKVRMAKKI